jgi:sporulation protein YlmC with PRC-barrel domain
MAIVKAKAKVKAIASRQSSAQSSLCVVEQTWLPRVITMTFYPTQPRNQAMKMNLSRLTLASLATFALVGSLSTQALAQVAGGTTTVGVNVTESTQLALGWSVKKTLLGKMIYNDAGDKVGKVEDLIISPEKNLTYIIVGAGGFIGIGRHDVAIPVSQIQDKSGRLVMPNASKEMIKAMPVFAYATDNSKRDAFVAAADADIAKGKAKIADLEKKAGNAATDAKAKMNSEMTAIKADVKSAEVKLGEMKRATVLRWREFEVDVNAATAKLRKAIETATS